MSSAELILRAREERILKVIRRALSGDVVTVKANVPGRDKNIAESFLIVRHFTGVLIERYGGTAEIFNGDDGMYALVGGLKSIDKDALVKIELSNPAGRFADLDLYLKGTSSSVSRGYMRKCFICDKPAFVCAREGSHGVDALLGVFKSEIRSYFTTQIEKIIKESLMAELNLENKFGLVSPSSQGSHKDLDYSLMIRAQDAVLPHLVKMFWQGFDGECDSLEQLRPTGITAEKAMLAATGGANAYKGMIFVIGVILSSLGKLLSSGNGRYGDLFDNVRKICKGVTNELRDGRANGTYGAYAFNKYGITGVRGHAERGFDTAEKAARIIDSEYSAESLLKALCFITGEIEDTVLLKRSGSRGKYLYFKNSISSLDITDKQKLKILNEECLKANVSAGGAADVLAASIMLKKFCSLLYLDK